MSKKRYHALSYHNHRPLGILFIFFVLSALMLPAISAQWGSPRYFLETGMRDVIDAVKGFFGPFFEAVIGVSQFDQYFFARILILILVFIVTYLVLNQTNIFKGKAGVNIVISVIMGVLGARYIGEIDFIYTILLPYGALMIALSTIFPFLVFFYFLHKTMDSGAARRAAGVFFAIIFIGLWWTRREIVPQYDWIYNTAMIGTILAVIFDPKVHEWFGLAEWQKARRESVERSMAYLKAKRENLINLHSTDPDVIAEIKRLEKQIAELSKKR